MKARIIPIGNSKGIRIPKSLLEQSGLAGEVEIVAKNGSLVIRPIKRPREGWAEAFDEPRRWGVGCLLVEYPGYGRSGGSPSEASIAKAMTGAYDLATALPGVDPTRVVAYGRSLGGGAACDLARHRPVSALVLESTFTSVRSFLHSRLLGFLLPDPFDNLSLVQSFAGPLLIMHGTRDTLIPVAQAEQLHRVAPRSELVLEPCGHNDCPRPWPVLREFLVRAGVL